MSLEELMNVEIVSASRKSEKVFDAPVTSFVISKQEIANSGVLSIPEALRLCPGVIVRENSPGSYDVSIRGGSDGLPTYQYANNNTTLLAMIDNRPIFNNFQGGVYWANLPITLVDVERIEIVLGASSPLYGPNAVSGVVNIITKKLVKDGLNINANVQYGHNNTVVSNVLGGYKVNSKFDVGFSVNGIARERTNIDYYDPGTDMYVKNVNDFINSGVAANGLYMGDKHLGHTQTGVNIFSNYNPTAKIKFMGTFGYNNSKNLFSIFNTETQLSHFKNEGLNYYLKGEIHNLNLQASYITGRQGLGGNNIPYQYNYNTADLYLDYNLALGKKLTIKPALSYQRAFISDKQFTIDQNRIGPFNGEAKLINIAASIKADLNLSKFRFIAAARLDKFTYPEKAYLSYQFIANYKLNSNNIFRAIVGKSYQGSFIATSSMNFRSVTDYSSGIPNEIFVKGGKNMKLLENLMYEIGYRNNISKYLITDISVTRQEFQNFNSYVLQSPQFYDSITIPNVGSFPTRATTDLQFQNTDLKAVQYSVTASFTTNLFDSKLSIKPNITFQKTTVSNYSDNYAVNDPNFYPNYNIATIKPINFQTTPTWYGGVLVTYKISSKFIVASQLYAYSSYNLTTNATTVGQPVTDKSISTLPNTVISNKFITNLTISYKVIKPLTISLNCRNLFNNTSRENFGSDKIGALYLVGLNYEY